MLVRSLINLASQISANLRGQIDIIITLLAVMAVVIGVVGSIALSGVLSLNVLERRREIGVMRAIGASARTIASLFVGEGAKVREFDVGTGRLQHRWSQQRLDVYFCSWLVTALYAWSEVAVALHMRGDSTHSWEDEATDKPAWWVSKLYPLSCDSYLYPCLWNKRRNIRYPTHVELLCSIRR